MLKKLQFKGMTKLIAACLAAVMLCFCNIGAVLAVEDDTKTETSAKEKESTKNKEDKEDKKEEKEKEEKEDKAAKPVLDESEAGILIDSLGGRVAFESNSTKKMYPASTTKIMTALLAVEAIERGDATMDDVVTITAEMLEDLPYDGTSIALKEGEQISLKALLQGLMVASGNDAARAIAVHIGGSVSSFVDTMNTRASEIGAVNTHFANPHGLHDENHYTTAADMAQIAYTAMKLEKFRAIADIAHIKIPPTNLSEERYYINTNGLLSTMRYTDFYFEGSLGIKTGYTEAAGNCLVSAAQRNGVELIAVIFGAKDAKSSHTKSARMLEWGFENLTTIVALEKGAMPCEIKVKQGKDTDSLTLAVKDAVSVVVPKDTKIEDLKIQPNIQESIYAPVSVDSEIGSVSVLLNDEVIGSGVLVATKTVERSVFWPAMSLGEKLWGMTFFRIAVYTLIGAVSLMILIFVTAMYRNIKNAQKRKKRTK